MILSILLAVSGGLTGTILLYDFFWFMCFAWIGHFIMVNMDVMTRDVEKPGTPVKFSWRIYFASNIKRVLFTCLLFYIVIRFYPNFFERPLGDFGALVVGFGAENITILLRKYTKLGKWL